MQPSSDQTNRGGVQVPSRSGQTSSTSTSRDAAVNLMRQQIDSIYEEPQPNEKLVATEPAAQPTATARTHDDNNDLQAGSASPALQAHWQQYHSAWQQYYQMYYERYYQSQVQKRLSETAQPQVAALVAEPAVLTEEQAVKELRSELLKKVRSSGKKIRRSRHFMPAIAALVVAATFIFVQYNQIILANVMAFTTPSMSDSANSYIDANTDVTVGPEPLIKIPKIGVEAPVVYDLPSLSESVVQSKLRDGVVQYALPGANAVPGQLGNTVILGHSANDVFAEGNYKFIFLRLDNLTKGDPFYLNYQGKRYTYVVTDKKVIAPNQIDQLMFTGPKPTATLVTCTPVGTSTNRLLVIGEQVSPDPTHANAAPTPTENTNNNASNIGGGSKSFLERLFGG